MPAAKKAHPPSPPGSKVAKAKKVAKKMHGRGVNETLDEFALSFQQAPKLRVDMTSLTPKPQPQSPSQPKEG